MVAQRSGAIINLSSYAGVKPRPNCADYASAKAGVAHLTQCLALEWSPWACASTPSHRASSKRP
ncbi:SDR family NAD(P)-dependent oxidoreductase [Achromobacter xylosoxidans]